MSNKFTQAAKDALGGSKVMHGRTKVTTEYVIANYPNGVTITEFDFIVKGDGTSYPVFAFAEKPDAYFNGGALAAKVANNWVSMYDGDVDAASEALKADGGAKFILSQKKTRTGKTITAFEPVE